VKSPFAPAVLYLGGRSNRYAGAGWEENEQKYRRRHASRDPDASAFDNGFPQYENSPFTPAGLLERNSSLLRGARRILRNPDASRSKRFASIVLFVLAIVLLVAVVVSLIGSVVVQL
jgi:hypothetical protein